MYPPPPLQHSSYHQHYTTPTGTLVVLRREGGRGGLSVKIAKLLVVFLELEKQFKHLRYGLRDRGGDQQVFLDVAQASGVAK